MTTSAVSPPRSITSQNTYNHSLNKINVVKYDSGRIKLFTLQVHALASWCIVTLLIYSLIPRLAPPNIYTM